MKKVVNGKVVEIYNIELFEKAAEGIAVGRLTSSNIADRIVVGHELINRCIRIYEAFYKAMPYPLYAVESNAKYAAIGTYIKKVVGAEAKMWVDNALFIWMDKEQGSALKMVSNTWSITHVDEEKEDNVNLENFYSDLGYSEYYWLLMQVESKGGSTSSFYEEFMTEFVTACNREPFVMQWELTNILNFGPVPSALNLGVNKIVDLESQSEYIIDIFTAGTRPTGKEEYVMSFTNKSSDVEIKAKQTKVFNYEAYEKPSSDSSSIMGVVNKDQGNKLQKHKMAGFLNLFQTLSSLRICYNADQFEDYTGFVSEGDMVYSIRNRIFLCKAYKFVETKEIASGMELHGYDRGLVYMSRTENVAKGVLKESIFSYSIKDGTVRLCKIHFIEGVRSQHV